MNLSMIKSWPLHLHTIYNIYEYIVINKKYIKVVRCELGSIKLCISKLYVEKKSSSNMGLSFKLK